MNRLGLAGVLALCACGQPSGQNIENVTVAESGSAISGESAAALPDYLHAYPNATPVEVANLGVAGTDSRSGNAAAWETDATPLEVATFYRKQFAEAGVPVRVDTANAGGGMIAIGRDGERGALLTISPVGGKTRIAVIRRPGG